MRVSVDDIVDIYSDRLVELDPPLPVRSRLDLLNESLSPKGPTISPDVSSSRDLSSISIGSINQGASRVPRATRRHRRTHSTLASLNISALPPIPTTNDPNKEEIARFNQSNEKYLERVGAKLTDTLSQLNIGRKSLLDGILEQVQLQLAKEQRAKQEKEEQVRRQEIARLEREKAAEESKRHAEAEARRIAELERTKREQKEAAEKEAKERAARQLKEAEAAERKRVEEQKQALEAKRAALAESQAKTVSNASTTAPTGAPSATLSALTVPSSAQSTLQSSQSTVEPVDGVGTDWPAVNREFEENEAKIQWIKTNIMQAVASDATTKNTAFKIKIQLKPKLGQLTNSKQQLFRIRGEVREILSAARDQQSDLIYRWTLNMFSKFVVQQSESEANVAMQAALPLAMLTILIWSEFPELGDFIIARFTKKCPHVIGFSCDTSTEKGLKRMGYRREEGRWEPEDKYSERMAGVCSVWSAMTQSKLSTAQNTKHPFPIHHGWKFLARQLNRKADEVTNAHCSVLASWWDMSAMRFKEAFGKQGEKLLQTTWDNYTNAVSSKRYPAAARLRLLGEDWRREGVLKPAWKPLEA